MSASTTTQFATEQGERLLRGVITQIKRTLRSHGVNEVHDLRVAIRRFMRILVVLKPCFPRAESRRIRRALKRIMVQAGTVRDRDVAIRLLAKTPAPEAAAIVQQLRERREEAARTLSVTLERWAQRNLAVAWRKALASESQHRGEDARFCGTPVVSIAKRMLPEMATEHFRRGKEASHDDASVREIHEFRIAAKNLRYTLDLFAPLYGLSLAALLKQLQEVQALLGDINDCATARRTLSRQGNKEVLAAFKRRQRKKTEQFRKNYRAEFSSAATLHLWKDSLRHVSVAAASRPTGRRLPS